MKKFIKKLTAAFLACLLITTTMVTAFAENRNSDESTSITITTNLENGSIQKGRRKTIDVFAKDSSGDKISSKVTLNGDKVPVKWDDKEKTSFGLVFKIEGDNTVVISASADGETAIKTYHITYEKAKPGDIIGYSTWSVEAFTIGNGYIIKPIRMPIIEGENAAAMLDKLIKKSGFDYRKTGSVKSSFYLSEIKNDNKKLNIKNNIPSVIIDNLGMNIEESEMNSLGEFCFTCLSGWMYCVNNKFPNVGFSDTYLSDGDVVRTQFTLALGSDIGGGWGSSFFETANKDELTKLIAKCNSSKYKSKLRRDEDFQSSYEDAIDVLEQVDIDQDSVDDVYDDLYFEMQLTPLEDISLNKTDITLSKGSSETLKIKYEPKDTDDDKTATWTSSDPSVAKVENGKVTGKSKGTATITAKVGDYTVDCDVTVKSSSGKRSSENNTIESSGSITEDKAKVLSDSDTDVSIIASSTVIPKDTQMLVSPITNENTENYSIVNKAVKDISSKQTVYDLTLKSDGVKIQPKGKVTIKLPIPNGYDRTRLAVVWIKPDGTFQNIDYKIDNDYILFEADHFSLYSIIEKSPSNEVLTEISEVPAKTKTSVPVLISTNKIKKAEVTSENPKTGETYSLSLIILSIMILSAYVFISFHKKSIKTAGSEE